MVWTTIYTGEILANLAICSVARSPSMWRSPFYCFTDGALWGCWRWTTTVYVGSNPIDSSPMHHCHSEHILTSLPTSCLPIVGLLKTWWPRTPLSIRSSAFSISCDTQYCSYLHYTFLVTIAKFIPSHFMPFRQNKWLPKFPGLQYIAITTSCNPNSVMLLTIMRDRSWVYLYIPSHYEQ